MKRLLHSSRITLNIDNLEIAGHAHIELENKIQCTINEILDDETNKLFMGIGTIKNLRKSYL